jgi:hypothetical protein
MIDRPLYAIINKSQQPHLHLGRSLRETNSKLAGSRRGKSATSPVLPILLLGHHLHLVSSRSCIFFLSLVFPEPYQLLVRDE